MIGFVLSLLGLLLVVFGVIGFVLGAYCIAKALTEIIEDEEDKEKLKKMFDK